ncbi:MAG: selenide, water dikinase SelD [Spirochaetes bacterium]|nr:selenide, water dikinase SelD [Spirochaetota bacterium]
MFDLLTTVESGGCSAKIPAQQLKDLLQDFQIPENVNLLVGADSSDDAMVWKLNNDTALIFTTDFFPPICSDPYQFGQIAAANSISDIYAMGGQPIMGLNLMMFPSSKIDLKVLKLILKGGADKAVEAGVVVSGGHTIDDYPPKYGLAVLGMVHPDRIVTNNQAEKGDVLVLTKPLGTGVLTSGIKIGEAKQEDYESALNTMKQLNREAAQIMQKYNIRCATDITGFGLLGHALNIARESHKTLIIKTQQLPLLRGVYELIDLGCISCAAFNNLRNVESGVKYNREVDYNLKMAALDAQTSGGILMCVSQNILAEIITELKVFYPHVSIIGEVQAFQGADQLIIVQ